MSGIAGGVWWGVATAILVVAGSAAFAVWYGWRDRAERKAQHRAQVLAWRRARDERPA